MLDKGFILKRLYDSLESSARTRRIGDLRIGLGYLAVKLDNEAAGLAAMIPEMTSKGCTVLQEAGTLAGLTAVETLKYLINGQTPLHLAIGLSTANALINSVIDQTEDRDATSYLNLKPGEKVAMVGLFAPLVERIRSTGASLTIIEKNPNRMELLSQDEKKQALKNCDVAIITATTLLNNTFEETINLLGTPRTVTLLGPSTPLSPEIFKNTPVTHLGGAVVADPGRVLQIVSEGGGTPALRSSLRFVNLILQSES